MRPTRHCFIAIALFSLSACKQPYRVGEHVWVEWEKGKLYPAYVIEKKGQSRYRVHYEGYDVRWDEDVTLDRIHGRVAGPTKRLPPPDRVVRATGGKKPGKSDSSQSAAYKVGDRVKVTWRGSTYSATVVGIVDRDKFLIHYDGYESAWDEVVHRDRIAKKR